MKKTAIVTGSSRGIVHKSPSAAAHSISPAKPFRPAQRASKNRPAPAAANAHGHAPGWKNDAAKQPAQKEGPSASIQRLRSMGAVPNGLMGSAFVFAFILIQRLSIRQTAWAVMPFSSPSKPIPSEVVALTLTCDTSTPIWAARLARIWSI